MATSLRLRPDAEQAVRTEAQRTGQSQQDLIREAVDQYLVFGRADVPRTDADALLARGALLPARGPFRRSECRLSLPEGTTSLDLLDRDDRL